LSQVSGGHDASGLSIARDVPRRRDVISEAYRLLPIAPYLCLLASLLIYWLARSVLISVAVRPGNGALMLDASVLVLAAALAFVTYGEIPAPLRLLARGIGVIVLIQLAFDAGNIFLGSAGADPVFFRFGTVLGLLAGMLALWRPAFLMPLFYHYVAFRHQIGVATGIEISETDYLSMLDIGAFLAIGALVAVIATGRWSPLRAWSAEQHLELRRVACSLIWACAIGAHLGNYFISAWTKIRAGGADPLFWLLHNPTQTSILIGLERGDNPLAAWPAAVQLSWDAIVGGSTVVNAFVLGSQLASPLAVVTRRCLMAFVLLFDLFHIGVYFTLGALFFFWIAVNTLIFVSARRMRDDELTWPMRVVALLAVGFGHYAFYTSHLGWLDGAKLASPNFFAETSDGRLTPVPSSYFGIASYSIAQTVMFVPDDYFPFRIGGNTYNVQDWRDSQACGPATVHHQDTGVDLHAVDGLVQQTDAAMRRHPLVKDLNLYYLYPHHMVPNPFMFRPFNDLSVDDIVRYHYVVDSVCLGLHDGRLARDVRKRFDHVIDVR
jgi:hypothetical protein